MSDTMTTEPARNFLDGLRLGDPVTIHNVTMFPLIGEDRPGPAYTTLHQALASKTASVSEISESGSVPELKFRNDGDIAVFLLDGEELIGAKQNRILNISILVPAKSEIKIPVSCVEQGRWRYTSGAFSSSNRTLFAAARKAKSVCRQGVHDTIEPRASLGRPARTPPLVRLARRPAGCAGLRAPSERARQQKGRLR